MKQFLAFCLPLIVTSTCVATSNVTFSGSGYEISVTLSDQDCKVVGLNVSSETPNIIYLSADELTAFSKAEADCKQKTIHLVVPATKSHPSFELKSTSKSGRMTLGKKKLNVLPDWLM